MTDRDAPDLLLTGGVIHTLDPAQPVVADLAVKDGRVLNYFSMVTTVGAPQTIATQELRIECLYPAGS